jgi:DNA-binding LytR/AlgR family response regulator
VEISKIIFIKGDGPYSIIHMANEKHTVAKTIKTLATELPSDFVRIHKSYFINKKYLKGFAKGKVFLFDNICLPLSRNGSKNL